jgi:nucleotide-binding universal stress UspA family protein
VSNSVYDAIVVGSDGSDTSVRAVQRAALYGEALSAPVVIATAYIRPTEGEVGPASERATMPQQSMVASGYRAATDTAADAAKQAQQVAPKAKVDTAAVEGDPAEALIELVSSRGDALVVVGSKGMTGSKRFLLGSVPNKISHHAPGDVLIARTDNDQAVSLPKSVLIGTDGSKTATRALDRGLQLAAAIDAKVTVLTAGDGGRADKVLADAESRAKDAGVDCSTVAAHGEAADELLAAAEDHDLVIVGNKGMTGASRFLLGSVPNKVSHHIGADLLIVRTT